MPAFPTTGVLDNTTRADENPLSDGGKWTTPLRSGDEKLKLQSNLVGAAGTASSFPNAGWNASTFGPSAEAWFAINSWDTVSGGTFYFLFVDVQTLSVVSPVYYAAQLSLGIAGNPTGLVLRRTGANAWAAGQSLTGLPATVTAGDQFGMRANGRIIEAWFQHGGTWTLVGSADDSTLSGTSGLSAGFVGWGQQFSGANGNLIRTSVFGGGTMVGGGLGRLPLLGAG